MLFNVMISRFFTKNSGNGKTGEKKAGKRETATTLLYITNYNYSQFFEKKPFKLYFSDWKYNLKGLFK
jgi:hypothetical protein